MTIPKIAAMTTLVVGVFVGCLLIHEPSGAGEECGGFPQPA